MRLYEHQPSGTVARARDLRRNATGAEKRLLRALKESFPTFKWRFQVPFGPYYVDFLSFSQKLVIEVDGGLHADAVAYDEARTRMIEQEGYRLLRFWNNDALANPEGVIDAIRNSLSLWEREGAPEARKGEGDQPQPSRAHPHPAALTRLSPLPQGEGL